MVKGMTKCSDETKIVNLRLDKRLLKINEMFWKKNQRIGRLYIFLPVETHLSQHTESVGDLGVGLFSVSYWNIKVSAKEHF